MVLVIAIFQDYAECKISNRLVVIGWITSIIYNISLLGLEGLILWILGGITPILLLIILFKFRFIGAGDIKLLSVIGSYVGVKSILFIICYSFLIGAAFSLIKMLYHKCLRTRLQYLAGYFTKLLMFRKIEPYVEFSKIEKKNVLHFSVCIALGLLVYKLIGEVTII